MRAEGELRHFIGENRGIIATDATSRAIWLPGGEVPSVGSIIAQPALAATLQRLAAFGPADIFDGALARDLAADCADVGALVTAQYPSDVRRRQGDAVSGALLLRAVDG